MWSDMSGAAARTGSLFEKEGEKLYKNIVEAGV